MSAQQQSPLASRKGLRALAIALVAAIIIGGAALIGVGLWSAAQTGSQAGSTVERRAVDPVGGIHDAPAAAAPVEVSIPAFGFSANIEPLAVGASQVIYPPTANSVYWLSDYGLVGGGSDNTAYLVGHTSADNRAVFDPLVDRLAEESNVMPGDEILVETDTGTSVYEIVAVERHDKTALADLENVWTNTPERLVLITCFFTAEGAAPDNMVVFARLTGGVG